MVVKFAGGLIQLNHGRHQSLQYVVNAAFMASLFADYMEARGVPGWNCGPNYIPRSDLKSFATSQVIIFFILVLVHIFLSVVLFQQSNSDIFRHNFVSDHQKFSKFSFRKH